LNKSLRLPNRAIAEENRTMNIGVLFVPAESTQGFVEFAYGTDLSNVLKELGDVELLAAIDAPNKAKYSKDRATELRAALVHLRTAHTSFRKILDTGGMKGGMTDVYRYGYARNRAVWVSLIRAVIYNHYDEQHSVVECLVDATHAWNMYATSVNTEDDWQKLAGGLVYFGTGKAWIDIARNSVRARLGTAPKLFAITRTELTRFYELFDLEFNGTSEVDFA